MIYDSTHDFLYTGIGMCLGFILGMFYIYMTKEVKNKSINGGKRK